MSNSNGAQMSPIQRMDTLKDEMRKLLILSPDECVNFKTLQNIIRTYTNEGVGYCFDRLLYYYVYNVSIDNVQISTFCSVMDKFFLFNGIKGGMNIMSIFESGDHVKLLVQLLISSIISTALAEFPVEIYKDFFIDGVMTDHQYSNAIKTIGEHKNFVDLIELIEDNLDISDNPTIEEYINAVSSTVDELYYGTTTDENRFFHDIVTKYVSAVSRYLRPRINIANESLENSMRRLNINTPHLSILLSDLLKIENDDGLIKQITTKKLEQPSKNVSRRIRTNAARQSKRSL